MTNTEKPIYGEWQPIKTAPKEKKILLLWDYETMCTGYYTLTFKDDLEPDEWGYAKEPRPNLKDVFAWKPDNWMPLPTGREGEVMRKMQDALASLVSQSKDARGVILEYIDMPCTSLRDKFPTTCVRLQHKIAKAEQALTEADEILGE